MMKDLMLVFGNSGLGGGDVDDDDSDLYCWTLCEVSLSSFCYTLNCFTLCLVLFWRYLTRGTCYS